MKIVSCFSGLDEISPLIRAGADELYCGIKELAPFGHGCLPLGDIGEAIKKIHAAGKRAALAVNHIYLCHNDRSLSLFMERLAKIDGMGLDAFIVSSHSVFMMLESLGRPLKAQIHLSSVQPCFNSMAAGHFIRRGISRLILHNQLSPLEARNIISRCRAAGVETEIFDYRFFGCPYINGRCHLHYPEYHTFTGEMSGAALCRCGSDTGRPVRMKPLNIDPGRAKEIPAIWGRFSGRMSGGGAPRISTAAAFFDFFASGVNYLKYGTRPDPISVKLQKVAELRSMLDLAQELSAKSGRPEARAKFVQRMERWAK